MYAYMLRNGLFCQHQQHQPQKMQASCLDQVQLRVLQLQLLSFQIKFVDIP